MLDPATGVISGIPGCPANVFCIFPTTYTFTVQITDSAANTTTRQLSIRVARPLAITTASPLPTGVQGASYGPLTLTATGGIGPLTWAPIANIDGLPLNTSRDPAGSPT